MITTISTLHPYVVSLHKILQATGRNCFKVFCAKIIHIGFYGFTRINLATQAKPLS